MASNNKVKVEDLITCSICLELFDDPRLLSCSHTFCYKCIEQTASAHGDRFECPLRDECQILRKDIVSLPFNRGIRDLVELYGSTKRSLLCTCCQMVVAEYACNTCENEKFCSECYGKEHTSRLMQKHTKLPISGATPEMVLCERHPKKQIEYWCETCRRTICIDCLLFQHKDHKYVPIEDAAKTYETKMNIRFQSIQSSLEHKITQTEMLINAVKNDSERDRSSITETIISLRRMINDHEKVMLQEISAVATEQSKKLKDYQTSLKTELQGCNMEKATFEILLSTKNHIKLFNNERKFDEYVSKTNEKLKLREGPTRTEYSLEGLDQLGVLKQNISQCGRYIQVQQYRNETLEQLIAKNQTTKELNLRKRRLTDSDMKLVSEMLRRNNALTILGLHENEIGSQGAQYIAEALKTNQTLTTLYLGQNEIGKEVMDRLKQSLKSKKNFTVYWY